MERKEFHFDFNEDAEPVEELHRRRVAVSEHFKTTEAIMEYIRSTPTAEEFLASLDAKAKTKKAPAKTARRRTTPKSPPSAAPRSLRKPSRRPVHS